MSDERDAESVNADGLDGVRKSLSLLTDALLRERRRCLTPFPPEPADGVYHFARAGDLSTRPASS
jgi:hypothetical protein